MCMMVRNLNDDLKNGTRVIVNRLSVRSVRVVEPSVYQGPGFAYGDESFKHVHYIPRIMFKWQIKRNRRFAEHRQFFLHPAYAMTCNKSQGKTMEKVALDLTSAPFAHGQLHVLVGRVHKREKIELYVSLPQCGHDDEGAYVTTVNVVERVAMEAAMPSHKAALLQANCAPVV